MIDHPRLISRVVVAAYVGVCADTFDKYVREGKFPKPIRIGKRKVWDIKAIDKAIDIMSGLGRHDTNVHSEPAKDAINAYFGKT